MSDVIEKQIELKAPVSRVWQALTDYRQFNAWFRLRLETPFVEGKITRGALAYPGYEHLICEMQVTKIEPEHYFAYTWHPYAVDPAVDYSQEPPTLVEFRLQPKGEGTLLTVKESGFNAIPAHRRAKALRMNDSGWAAQMKNIETYVAQHSQTAL